MQPLSKDQTAQFIRDGYVIVPGLIPSDVARETRAALLAAMNIAPDDPQSWEGKNLSGAAAVLALTEPCRSPAVEAAATQLVGPDFVRGIAHSPYLEAMNLPSMMKGFIPVLNFPIPGPREFVPPGSYHIDGMHLTTTWPEKFSLVVFAYLSDTARYGGATTVLPGSHRQVFEHWVKTGDAGNTVPPQLDFAAPLPLEGKAGDVIFLHYLTVHSGSANHSDQIRVGLNTAVMPDPNHPYERKTGAPQADWTPLDRTLRTDNLASL